MRHLFPHLLAVLAALLAPAFGPEPVEASTSQPAPSAIDASVDSLDWAGLPAVEAKVRARVAELWAIDAAEVALEFGIVNTAWVPGSDLTVELRGTGRGGWFVVVASDPTGDVSLRVRAGREVLRTVAARPLSRGTLLEEDDLALARVALWGMETPSTMSDVVGWEVKRTVDAGEILEEPTVAPPAAAVSGRPVEIEFRHGAVSITMPGTALGTVPIGGSLYVRTRSGERLRGVAVAPGRVLVQSSTSG